MNVVRGTNQKLHARIKFVNRHWGRQMAGRMDEWTEGWTDRQKDLKQCLGIKRFWFKLNSILLCVTLPRITDQ